MASLNNIIQEVQDITTRPDPGVLGLIKSSVRDAILACHSVAEFPRDLRTVAATGFVASQEAKYAFPVPARYRKFSRLEALYPDGAIRDKFTRVDSLLKTDYFGFQQAEIFYEAGDAINLRYAGSPTALHLTYLSFPEIDITALTSSSFIVTEMPAGIVHMAASKVFRAIGKADDAQAYLVMARTLDLPDLRDNFSHLD